MGETWERVKQALNGWSGVLAAAALAIPWGSAALAWAAGHENVAKYLSAGGVAVILTSPLVIGATTMVIRRLPWRGYNVKSVSRVYEFDSIDPSIQRATWERTIVLLNSATKVMDFDYGWTGKGTREVPTVEPLTCQVLDMEAPDPRDHHLVLLGSGFPTRKEQIVVLRQTFHDPGFTMRTFFSVSTRRPIGSLSQCVKFSPSKPPLKGSVFYVVTERSAEKCVDQRQMDIQYDKNGIPFVEVAEPKPRKNRDYKIQWTWPAG
jgi:hypothetical protein